PREGRGPPCRIVLLAEAGPHARFVRQYARRVASRILRAEVAMAQPEKFEALVLGGGNGGMYLAWHMARQGRRTAVLERRWIGGSCPNINCLPSKNKIWSAKVADLVHRAASFGTITGSVAIDMPRVRQRKRDMVDGMIALTLEQYKSTGAELIMGTGHFAGPK